MRKPWVIEARWRFLLGEEWTGWQTWQRYETERQFDQALSDLRHRYHDRDYIEFRGGRR